MSKVILQKLEQLEQELSSLKDSLLSKQGSRARENLASLEEASETQQQLKVEQHKNQKVNDILHKNILKLQKVIEKEEKSDA
jgi:hypothetical protein